MPFLDYYMEADEIRTWGIWGFVASSPVKSMGSAESLRCSKLSQGCNVINKHLFLPAVIVGSDTKATT